MLFKILVFILGCTTLIPTVFFNSDEHIRNSVIRQVLSSRNTQYWAKLDGKSFCKDIAEGEISPYSLLEKFVDSKVGIIYLTNVDILICKGYIQTIAERFHTYDLLLAMNIDSSFDTKSIFGENYSSFNPDYFNDRLKGTESVTEWVSYLVFDDALSFFTFSERREIQLRLRNIFINSFIGFRFFKSVTPTPDNNHPVRQTPWNEFLPRDDDGDFIITSIPVSSFKRTLVIAEDLDIQNSNGKMVNMFN